MFMQPDLRLLHLLVNKYGMLHDIFKSIGGTESFGMISMILFVVFFVILVLHTLLMRKKDVDDFSRMPLNDFSKESDDIQDI